MDLRPRQSGCISGIVGVEEEAGQKLTSLLIKKLLLTVAANQA